MQLTSAGRDSSACEVKQYENIDAAAAMRAIKLLTLNREIRMQFTL